MFLVFEQQKLVVLLTIRNFTCIGGAITSKTLKGMAKLKI